MTCTITHTCCAAVCLCLCQQRLTLLSIPSLPLLHPLPDLVSPPALLCCLLPPSFLAYTPTNNNRPASLGAACCSRPCSSPALAASLASCLSCLQSSLSCCGAGPLQSPRCRACGTTATTVPSLVWMRRRRRKGWGWVPQQEWEEERVGLVQRQQPQREQEQLLLQVAVAAAAVAVRWGRLSSRSCF